MIRGRARIGSSSSSASCWSPPRAGHLRWPIDCSSGCHAASTPAAGIFSGFARPPSSPRISTASHTANTWPGRASRPSDDHDSPRSSCALARRPAGAARAARWPAQRIVPEHEAALGAGILRGASRRPEIKAFAAADLPTRGLSRWHRDRSLPGGAMARRSSVAREDADGRAGRSGTLGAKSSSRERARPRAGSAHGGAC